jgi:chromosome partitioning protein
MPATKTLCSVNNKGGVGKTHTVFHLAGAVAEAGHRVLVIDLDEQANLTRLLLTRLERPTIYDVLVDQVPLARAIQFTPFKNLDVAPADARLERLAAVLLNEPDQQIRLDIAIRERQAQPAPYDCVLIDCPPSLSLATRNALAAADGVVIPVEADKFSVDGLQRLLETIQKMGGVNRRLHVEGVLISLYNGRRTVERAFEQALAKHPGVHVLPVQIKNSAKYREAIAARKPITHYRASSQYADAFRQLARVVGILTPNLVADLEPTTAYETSH